MTSTELVPATPARPVARRARAEADVQLPGGGRVTASAARRLRDSVPRNSHSARESRWNSYVTWCDTYGWDTAEPNAVLCFLDDLAGAGHPATTLDAHFGTLRMLRAMHRSALDKAEIKLCLAVISQRRGEEADDTQVEPGPLQADGVDLNELRLMVRTLDRTTARGKRDAAVLLLDWWMAGRASEPARLNLHDVKFTEVTVTDKKTGKKTRRPALIVKIRRSKADQAARGQEVRILAPDDQELCPLFALRAWMDVLADDHQLTPGPLLRRIDRHGNIGAKAAGRHTQDERRRGGITADTVNDIIKTTAQKAKLTPAPTPEERAAQALAAREAKEAARQAATAEESNAIMKTWRTARRAARAAVRRITGHSMRRGCIQALLDAGNPAEVVAVHSRHSPRSAAFDAYRPRRLTWSNNPTADLGLAA
ncbi:integrase [Streptomyces californicus]|uniref:integrase n=1 Tax=Streptomyces californicus TaxID=67351 RepID=UPI00296E9158|nr:integrase [Streptomyces californicus]MDW4912581.1 integrase [Streptomyces californicus]